MTQCPQCEAKIDESMSFCEECGMKLEWPEKANEPEQVEDVTDSTDDVVKDDQTEENEQTKPQEELLEEKAELGDEPQNSTEDKAELNDEPQNLIEDKHEQDGDIAMEQDEQPPVISPTKTQPKQEKKKLDMTKLALSSTIGVLLIAVATVFTLSFLALPSPQKWLDNANEAFIGGDKETFYKSFSKPEPMVANVDTFYEEMASDWPNIVAQMQVAIEKETPFATFQTSEGRDILQLTVVKQWGMTDVTVRYLPAEVTIVATKKHQTITLPNMELFSVRDDETFHIYAVPGTYPVQLMYKGQYSEQMIILQSKSPKAYVLGDAS